MIKKFGIIILVLTWVSVVGFCAIPASERAALIALYNSTNGDDWVYREGWKTAPLASDGFAASGTEGTWEGITVTSNHVTSILLPSNGLEGAIPSSFGDLRYIEFLNLNYNKISGSIPSGLGNMTKMTNLLLMGNTLTGSIPAEITNLTSLKVLMLNQNQLSGSIPSGIGSLSKLEGFYLAGNGLTGSIPSSIGNLSNLKSIDFSKNKLSGSIPSQITSLGKLVILNLSNNSLSGTIPVSFGSLGALQDLKLANNYITGKIPVSFSKLVKLFYLTLNNNQLFGEIPSSMKNLKEIGAMDIGYNCLRATDSGLRTWLNSKDPDWEANQNICGSPTIVLNRMQLYFGANTTGKVTSPQTVLIDNSGSGDLNWTATSTASWLSVSPSSGNSTGTITISVNPSGLAVGSYTGAVSVADSTATNSPQNVTVNLQVYAPGQGTTNVPFGDFATPAAGSTINNSVAVTGWVLDDIGIASVKIYNGEVYIGDALFVEGARPDVQAAFPTYPDNYKAGWGYMLLTRFLPNGGNGTYTLVARATDIEGNEVILGSKTVTIDNANALNPFGAIDTPTQGGIASGTEFINWGWALTPQPASIPTNGSTIDLFIDGVLIGHPYYNVYREDIATLFPGFANSNASMGYYIFDTTQYANGIHTISWNVTDNAGRTDGVGSRYFSILNTSSSSAVSSSSPTQNARTAKPGLQNHDINSIEHIYTDSMPIYVNYSYTDKTETPCIVEPGENSAFTIEMKEMERIIVNLFAAPSQMQNEIEPDTSSPLPTSHFPLHASGYMVVGNELRELPIGSTLDRIKRVFYWQPGPGFVGEYRFVFIGTDEDGQKVKKNIIVNIKVKN